MGVNRGIKFFKPVLLTKANVNCKFTRLITYQILPGPPKKVGGKYKLGTYKKEVGSWTLTGCKKRAKVNRCNFKNPPSQVVLQANSKLIFKCGTKTVSHSVMCFDITNKQFQQVFQCLKTRGQWNLESCKTGKKLCKKAKDRNFKTGKLNPFPYIKKEKLGPTRGMPKPDVKFPIGFKKMFNGKLDSLTCK